MERKKRIIEREKEIERETETERDREIETETETETDRQTELWWLSVTMQQFSITERWTVVRKKW